jgi:sugar phosphate isomerase/epimerase
MCVVNLMSVGDQLGMFKNLNASVLGVSGRQSELIELAMTYGFKGLDIDLGDLVKRTQRASFERAAKYLESAKMQIGSFEITVDLDADDAAFAKALASFVVAAEIAGKAGATIGNLRVPAATDRLPYHEFFEVVRKRIDQIAEVAGQHNIRVGLYFSAAIENREGKQFPFVKDAEGYLALFKACSASNVGLTIDTWNWTVGGGTIAQLASVPVNRILGLRLADASEGIDFATASITQRIMPAAQGVVDNVGIVTQLSKMGYEGPMAAYGHMSVVAGMTRDAIVSLAQDSIDAVLSTAGLPTYTRKPELIGESTAPVFAEIEA